ncbi:protein-glutamate methylesterase/protein-glutamine glutaminase [Paracraurococcus ruber]|uniref:Protein-glutamate methylesterase/protein-glutamine glutaminase n=1 Tax=Paracraurococcus ruber TaxID=77675 RepID=A0ABS1CQT6_9PROT|nr:chemotaxis response regulator protein-glutamate methylesterase [Paracraurococcus ruber]MBK1656662.1 chemotaxis response regulator protein-glutamate methylesterase [Paracraurococcus ruber]TDG33716.1 chemotaxis response regulator protein-glutamate methylesterase [Paracraurococcus ruber]
MTTARPIRVLIVDDSASVRQALTRVISHASDLEVMATAPDPFVAVQRMQQELPDVVILDIEMPRMDGITFLRRIMAQRPIPVVICSTLTEAGSDTLLQALEAGAVEVIPKPRVDTAQALLESEVRICDVIRAAAKVRVKARQDRMPRQPVAEKLSADVILPPPSGTRVLRTTERVVCIGASTGGTEALAAVLTRLPVECPGVVIVQHMPERFTSAFARRLDTLCHIEVREAEDGDAVLPGRALIAPGNKHLLLQRSGARYAVRIKDGPLVSRHRPSVDVLFRSAAQHAGPNAAGIIMTGMGDDGAKGLLEMRRAGAMTIAQDEQSCVVFGMPREAIELGAAERVLPLSLIPAEIVALGSRHGYAERGGPASRT